MGKVTIVELKDWQPYLSAPPEAAVNAVKSALNEKYGARSSITQTIVLSIEILEVRL